MRVGGRVSIRHLSGRPGLGDCKDPRRSGAARIGQGAKGKGQRSKGAC